MKKISRSHKEVSSLNYYCPTEIQFVFYIRFFYILRGTIKLNPPIYCRFLNQSGLPMCIHCV